MRRRIVPLLAVTTFSAAAALAWQQPDNQPPGPPPAAATAPTTATAGAQRTLPGGLIVVDLPPDAPPTAAKGDLVGLEYAGTLDDGTVFDSSATRVGAGGLSDLLVFTLGAGQVIKGFDLGVEGMRVGEKRRIVVPPELGYGARAVGSIPPNSRLTFEVTLVRVRKAS